MEEYNYQKTNGHYSTYTLVENEILGQSVKMSVDKNETIWAEKYRPRILEDLILPKDLMIKLKEYIDNQELPNIGWFSANGGTGKDSIMSVVKNNIEFDMLTINASMYSGIDVIRTKCMNFATTQAVNGAKKVIYLNELGNMSTNAMESLKGMIEEFSRYVVFMFSSNNLNNMSEAFLTRFHVIHLNDIPKEEKPDLAKKTMIRLIGILENEGIEYDINDIQTMMLDYKFSYRKLVVELQNNTKEGKFAYKKEYSRDTVIEFMEAVNKQEFIKICKMSTNIDVLSFMNYFSEHWLEHMKEKEQAPGFISAFNTLMDAVHKRVPFPAISICNFARDLIYQNKIKFKINI